MWFFHLITVGKYECSMGQVRICWRSVNIHADNFIAIHRLYWAARLSARISLGKFAVAKPAVCQQRLLFVGVALLLPTSDHKEIGPRSSFWRSYRYQQWLVISGTEFIGRLPRSRCAWLIYRLFFFSFISYFYEVQFLETLQTETKGTVLFFLVEVFGLQIHRSQTTLFFGKKCTTIFFGFPDKVEHLQSQNCKKLSTQNR